jgi:branched-chain amino acid transport system ATP-binding protein
VSLLAIEGVSRRFGGLTAVNNVSFTVEAGEILSVIGPNGAGKSTLFKLIAGFLRPSAGHILLDGKRIDGLRPHAIAARGLVRTFQESTVFREMSVLENVVVAHHLRRRHSILAELLATPAIHAEQKEFLTDSRKILARLGLAGLEEERARNLPHGHLRALGIAMALAVRPRVILLDEPFTGMNSEETERAVEIVLGIRESGITVVLEHDMGAVMRISDRIVVLNFGTLIASGAPAAIQQDEAVIDAYLGRADEIVALEV